LKDYEFLGQNNLNILSQKGFLKKSSLEIKYVKDHQVHKN
jgi:hypothetical protein